MVKLSDARQDSLAIASGLAAQGLQVFPARYKDKIPIVKWKDYIGTDARGMVPQWFKGRGQVNFWVMTGQMSGYAVIDCDSPEGEAWWREQLGDEIFDTTACVETKKGMHYWLTLDQPLPSWSVHPNTHKTDISFDMRADGTGVIVPPSIHESGFQYKWIRDLSHAQPAPPALLDGSVRENAPETRTGGTGATVGTGGQTRSLLSRLLSQPPSGEGSGRNDWLARVAGHYAKTYHNQEDLYEAHCEQANRAMGQPLDEAEFRKTIESIWKGEHERNTHREIDMSCGFLASGGHLIMCQVVVKSPDGETRQYEMVEYADFDLVAKGVMVDEAGRRTYWAEIVRRSRADVAVIERLDIVLRAEVLGDDRALRKTLAGYGCTIIPPDNMWPKAGSPGVRIQRYLEAQQPPIVEITPALGYHPSALAEGVGGYITHEGAITSGGLVGIESVSVRADPRLRAGGMAPHEYGFADNEVIARDVLSELLTFHDEAVTSVFGAWWAACLLKPQIEAKTSLFPFMAIEAPSESGKTNGYFQMMMQANGDTRGETQPTKAALRDMAAAHRNGITWVDDLDDPAYLMELLRAATSGGTLAKMGEDRESVKSTQIVAPIVISGEALGLGTQKALVDRAIILKAPSPTGRMSLHDPTRPQWDDVLAIRGRYPNGLHAIAGWFVQDALGVVERVEVALREGRTGGSGRTADKVAVLRAGARLLDYLVRQDGAWEGRGLHAGRVEGWLSGHLVDDTGTAITSNENALTLELVPWALRQWKFPEKPMAGDGPDTLDSPVFIKNYDPKKDSEQLFADANIEIGVNVALLAEAWDRHHRGHAEKRTATEAALRDQAMAMGFKSKRVRLVNGGSRLLYYFKIQGDVARAIVRRSIGG
jgi:hypothetical protein